MKPRIFISADATEFATIRRRLADVLRHIGCEPETEDVPGSGAGDFRATLRNTIDRCDGLIHVIGHSYGAEPPNVEREFGRVSYSQFEFLYALRQKKRTWLVRAGEACTRDRPNDQLDLPAASESDPARYRAERRAWQAAWQARWNNAAMPSHSVESDSDWEPFAERLKRELDTSVDTVRLEQRRATRRLTIVLLLASLAALATGRLAWQRSIERRRRKLIPRLNAIAQLRTNGELDAALKDCLELLAQDDTWPDLLFEHLWTRNARGDRSTNYGTVAECLLEYSTAEADVRRVMAIEPNNPYWNWELASCLERLGGVYLNLGRTEDALRSFEAESVAWRALFKTDLDASSVRRSFAAALERIGEVHLKLGRPEDALRQFDEALGIRRECLNSDSYDADAQAAYAAVLSWFGHVDWHCGRIDAALGRFEEALAISRSLVEAAPRNTLRQVGLAVDISQCGDALTQLGRHDEADAFFSEAFAIYRSLAEADPRHIPRQQWLATAYDRLGRMNLTFGKIHDSLQCFDNSKAITEKQMHADPSNVEIRRSVSWTYNSLGDALLRSGRAEDALKCFEDAMRIRRGLVEADPHNFDKRIDQAAASYEIGESLLSLGRIDDALRQFQETERLSRTLVEAAPTCAYAKCFLWNARCALGQVWIRKGDRLKGAEHIEQGLRIADAALAQAPRCLCPYDIAALHSLRLLLHSLRFPPADSAHPSERSDLTAKALRSLRAAIEGGERNLRGIRNDWNFDVLHGIPEFESLVAEPKQ